MKRLISISFLFLLALALLSACGGDSSTGATQPPDPTEVTWKRGEPSIAGAHGSPPPKKLIVKDLRVGSGAVLKKGRTATLKYKNFDYRTGQNYEDWWDRPFVTGFGKGESLDAWETGLKGMRVSGRRELVVPAKQAYGNVAQIYVLELVSVR